MAKSASRESVIYPSCFVCGFKKTGTHPLYIRQAGQPGPYFPFLETHEPPDGSEPPTQCGQVLTCYTCYALLIQQWESYEKNKVPLVKRIYWLKRVDNGPYTGVEMGMQSEYASQAFGLTPENQGQTETQKANSSFSENESNFRNSVTSPCLSVDGYKDSLSVSDSKNLTVKKPVQEEALDLSLERPKRKRKLAVCSSDEVEVKSPVVFNNPEVLDLSMPDKNASIEVCYLCGNKYEKGTLSDIYARNFDKYSPFFPRLVMHPRPNGSKPMEASGKVVACKVCLTDLLNQWKCFENLKIPYQMRKYEFRKQQSNLETYVCYKCGNVKTLSSLHLVCIHPNCEEKPFYPQLQLMPAKPGSIPITHHGEVIVCDECFNTLENERIAYTSRSGSDSGVNLSKEENPKRLSTSPVKMKCASNFICDGLDSVSCCLCHQNYSLKQMQTLSMVADPMNSNEMFFPFLKFLPQVTQNMITEDGRILACRACYAHLSSQWLDYEKDNIPYDQRHFSLRALSIASQSPRLTPRPPSDHSAPPSELYTSADSLPATLPTLQHSGNLGSKDDINKLVTREGYHGLSLKELEVVAVTSENTVTLAAITTQRALNININCFICGSHSKAGQTYSIKSKPNGKEMFFPFLDKHVSTYPEAAVDCSTYLVCLICFHSLVVQWQHYEKGRIEYHARFYDTYNFSCYICGTKTYRRRLYLIPVKDYPFLKEHTCPPGGMVVNNGHSVVVCKDCYVSLNEQYTALERLGVPVEKRQYNWIQRPPPPDLPENIAANKHKTKQLGPNPFLEHPSASQFHYASRNMSSTGGTSASSPQDMTNNNSHGNKERGGNSKEIKLQASTITFDGKNAT